MEELHPIPERVKDRKRKTSTSVSGWKKVVAVEVKANPVGIGDILRQFKLYDAYDSSILQSFSVREAEHFVSRQPRLSWVLATPYQLSSLDVEALSRANIRHVFLGPQFDEWCTEQQKARATAGLSKDSFVL